jgi:hypothetical protein
MNSQEIRRLESAAQRCDDRGQYLREMREVERLKAKQGARRATIETNSEASVRRSTGRRTATSINHAIAMMEGRA